MEEVGKCRTDALVAEILGTLDWLNWLENNAERLLKPEKVKTPITLLGKQSLLLHEPLGVVLIICPWNYPFHNAITGIAPTGLTGLVIKTRRLRDLPMWQVLGRRTCWCGRSRS
ncbi:aldehyde dehydrogenase family protein [Pseudomonas kitaguniensis]|uniref:aldehyde dehydrogenase family protein n=1 Tax=Pseudomonas kitaguniensis TaxID=2607908 RepID=UPI001F502678|nr:aldehyde dehydrogenase family protein [Pseudomonas kitaguniensis]